MAESYDYDILSNAIESDDECEQNEGSSSSKAAVSNSQPGQPPPPPAAALPSPHPSTSNDLSLLKNKLFQHNMDKINDETILEQEEAFETLAQLSRDFVASALTFGQIIIAERFLEDSEKTIKPEPSLGGLAGGEKFIIKHAGILFKFPTDKHNIYGGEEVAAMKAASRELTALVACWRLTHRIPEMSLPLMTNIDYRGYRIVATTLLPISARTLKYGSADAGNTVFKGTDAGVDSVAKRLSQMLNLKEHICGRFIQTTKSLWLPCDVELHRGHDDKIYIIDLARLMPCEPPKNNNTHNGTHKGTRKGRHLVELFRPELIANYPHASFSSDSFSLFEQHDPNQQQHREDLHQLWLHLTQSVIPNFSEDLDSLVEDVTEFGDFDLEFSRRLHKGSVLTMPGSSSGKRSDSVGSNETSSLVREPSGAARMAMEGGGDDSTTSRTEISSPSSVKQVSTVPGLKCCSSPPRLTGSENTVPTTPPPPLLSTPSTPCSTSYSTPPSSSDTQNASSLRAPTPLQRDSSLAGLIDNQPLRKFHMAGLSLIASRHLRNDHRHQRQSVSGEGGLGVSSDGGGGGSGGGGSGSDSGSDSGNGSSSGSRSSSSRKSSGMNEKMKLKREATSVESEMLKGAMLTQCLHERGKYVCVCVEFEVWYLKRQDRF